MNYSTPEPVHFKSDEICSIIRECAAAGVSALSVGGVNIEFYSKSTGSTQVPADVQLSEPHQLLDDPEKKKLIEIIEAQSEKLELLHKQEEESENLPLLDPDAWIESETQKNWKAEIDDQETSEIF